MTMQISLVTKQRIFCLDKCPIMLKIILRSKERLILPWYLRLTLYIGGM